MKGSLITMVDKSMVSYFVSKSTVTSVATFLRWASKLFLSCDVKDGYNRQQKASNLFTQEALFTAIFILPTFLSMTNIVFYFATLRVPCLAN
ncbi:hypothetical protein GQ44DRAFT_716167 [Phaeosphaeriaceae sp. PMI808]|nr:hypothetical protein GQ44DRAFT_716167 [Phaeosphaeriaceae sp. PMI808]